MAATLENSFLKFYRNEDVLTDANLSAGGQVGGLAKTPAGPSFACSRAYVDDCVGGIDPKEACDFVSYVSSFPPPDAGNLLRFTDGTTQVLASATVSHAFAAATEPIATDQTVEVNAGALSLTSDTASLSQGRYRFATAAGASFDARVTATATDGSSTTYQLEPLANSAALAATTDGLSVTPLTITATYVVTSHAEARALRARSEALGAGQEDDGGAPSATLALEGAQGGRVELTVDAGGAAALLASIRPAELNPDAAVAGAASIVGASSPGTQWAANPSSETTFTWLGEALGWKDGVAPSGGAVFMKTATFRFEYHNAALSIGGALEGAPRFATAPSASTAIEEQPRRVLFVNIGGAAPPTPPPSPGRRRRARTTACGSSDARARRSSTSGRRIGAATRWWITTGSPRRASRRRRGDAAAADQAVLLRPRPRGRRAP